MKSSRFSQEQIIGILKQGEAGVKVTDLCRQHGISDHTYYRWKSKFGGMEVSEAKRLKALEEENRQLKQLLGEKELDILGLRTALSKKVLTRPQQREAVAAIQTAGVSQRQACSLVGIWRCTCRYQPKGNREEDLIRQRLRDLAIARPRFGSPRLLFM